MAIFVEETIQQDPNLSAGTLDKQLTAFSMHIKGAIVECSSELALRPCTGTFGTCNLRRYPFSHMQHIRQSLSCCMIGCADCAA